MELFSIGLALLCAFGYGVYPFFTKKVIHRVGVLLTTFAVHIVLVFFLFLFFMFNSKIVLPGAQSLIYIIVGGIVGALTLVLYYKTIHIGNISVNIPLAHSHAIVSVLLGYYLFNETLSIFQYFAVGVVIVGGLLSATRFSKLRRKEKFFVEGAFLSLVVAIGWAVWNMMTNFAVKDIGPFYANLYMEILIFVVIALLFFLFGESISKVKEIKTYDIIYAGLLFAVGA
ncbi:EamA family transporter, partial [Candidatus Woesearchaeota archaeon]|nr:EamA family transporter [Candidatus Woesearchaeota archaeon]